MSYGILQYNRSPFPDFLSMLNPMGSSILIEMRSAFHQKVRKILTRGVKDENVIQGFNLLQESTIEFPFGLVSNIRFDRG
jgi:hypothetical protein